jgi:hypothetical protein
MFEEIQHVRLVLKKKLLPFLGEILGLRSIGQLADRQFGV